MTGEQPTKTFDGGGEVPTQWAAVRSDAPKPAWTVRGLPALPGMILLWFAPRRVGASLAASGWRAAIAAHLVGITLGLGMILAVEWLPMFGAAPPWQPFGMIVGVDIPGRETSWSELVRGPFAAVAFALHAGSAGPAGILFPVLWVLGIEAGVVLLAVVLMPFAAAGERGRRLFGRCLRLTWWSTTMLIPLGLGWWTASWWRGLVGLPNRWHPVDFVVLTLFGVWWLFVLLRSGYRYAGPADGPAWQPRTPRCERCGYEIVALSTATNCPECGRPVTESLPQHRQPPAFATPESFRESIRGFWSAIRQALMDRAFFEHLAIHSGHGRGRTLFLLAASLNSVVVFLITAVADLALVGAYVPALLLAHAMVLAGVVLLGQVLLAGVFAIVVSAVWRRAVQPVAVATFYAFLPLVVVTLAALPLVVTCAFLGRILDNVSMSSPVLLLIGFVMAVGLVGCGWGIACVGRNLNRAVRDTRFANG